MSGSLAVMPGEGVFCLFGWVGIAGELCRIGREGC